MNVLFRSTVKFFLIGFTVVFVLSRTCIADTIITGTVTDKRAGAVRDRVDLKKVMAVIDIDAGQEKDSTTNEPAKRILNNKSIGKLLNTREKPLLILSTSIGTITIELNRPKAPQTVKAIIDYASSGFYDGIVFHRVIKGFMIQGGGFTKDMQQKSTHTSIPNEAWNGLKNVRGTIAMARTRDPHSASSQFFINTANNRSLNFKGKNARGWGYCVFGKVVSGMEVVDAIESVKTTNFRQYTDVPIKPVVIKKAYIR